MIKRGKLDKGKETSIRVDSWHMTSRNDEETYIDVVNGMRTTCKLILKHLNRLLKVPKALCS